MARTQADAATVTTTRRWSAGSAAVHTAPLPPIAFVGGGNMATAIIGGLCKAGHDAGSMVVVEPVEEQRDKLRKEHGVVAIQEPGDALKKALLVVWAVKPQMFGAAAKPYKGLIGDALQLSVMAGIPISAIERATGSQAIVRTMPNTPALIGQGMTGLFASEGVTEEQKALVRQVLGPMGRLLWVTREADLNAVTALSGSGPAYIFFFVEAMIEAAQEMGLTAEQGRELALYTFAGATALALQSSDSPAELRAKVTSKGGTTYAAITSMETDAVKTLFKKALKKAQERAKELGDQFGT